MENKTSSDQNYKYSLKGFVSFMSIAFALFCFILFIVLYYSFIGKYMLIT